MKTPGYVFILSSLFLLVGCSGANRDSTGSSAPTSSPDPAASAQADAGAMTSQNANRDDDKGAWKLVITKQGFAPPPGTFETRWVSMGSQTVDSPGEQNSVVQSASIISIDKQKTFDCNPGDGPPAGHPCDFVSVEVTQNDAHSIGYKIRNWGARCNVGIRYFERAPTQIEDESQTGRWIVGRSFVLQVPTEATSATVVGNYEKNQIFFTPPVPPATLSPEDQKFFRLDEVKPVPSSTSPIATFYRFTVKGV